MGSYCDHYTKLAFKQVRKRFDILDNQLVGKKKNRTISRRDSQKKAKI